MFHIKLIKMVITPELYKNEFKLTGFIELDDTEFLPIHLSLNGALCVSFNLQLPIISARPDDLCTSCMIHDARFDEDCGFKNAIHCEI